MVKGGPWMIDMRLGMRVVHGGGSLVVFQGTPMWGSKGRRPGLGPVVGDGYPQGAAGLLAQRNKEALGSSQGVAPPDLGRGASWYGVGRALWWPSDGGLSFLDEGCYGRGSGQGPEGGGGCPLGPRFLDVGLVAVSGKSAGPGGRTGRSRLQAGQGVRTGCGHSGNSRHRSGPWVAVSSVQKKNVPISDISMSTGKSPLFPSHLYHGQGRALDDRHEAGEEGGSWWWLIGGVSWYPDVGFEGGPGLGPVVEDGYPQGAAGLLAQQNKEALGSSQGVAPPDLGRGTAWYGGSEGGDGCSLGPRFLDVGSVGGPGWVPDGGCACPHGPRFFDDGCNGRGPGWRPNGGGGCPHGLRFLDEGSFVGGLGRRPDGADVCTHGADWSRSQGRVQASGVEQGSLGCKQDGGLGQGTVTPATLGTAPGPGWQSARFRKKCPHFRHLNVYWEQSWNVFFISLGGSDPRPHRPPSGGAEPRSHGGPRKATMLQRCGPAVPMWRPAVPTRCSELWAMVTDHFFDEGVCYIFESPHLGAIEPSLLGCNRGTWGSMLGCKRLSEHSIAVVPSDHGGRTFSDECVSYVFERSLLGAIEPSFVGWNRGTCGGLMGCKRLSVHNSTVVPSDHGGLMTHRAVKFDKMLICRSWTHDTTSTRWCRPSLGSKD
ncbi:hypothetical protein GQ457_01G032120 [Hibiscus cannabinus]